MKSIVLAAGYATRLYPLTDNFPKPFVELFREKNSAVVMCSYKEDVAALHRSGVMIPDADFKVISMEEKPQDPKSNWCVGPFLHI